MDRVLPPTLTDVARPAMPCPAAPSIAPRARLRPGLGAHPDPVHQPAASA
jgi:hypothetical protein